MTSMERLQTYWPYGGFLAGSMLLALAPILTAGWDRAATLGFLTLPVYMLHQFEEHDDDRFRRFVNTVVAGGREALTIRAVFWINILGVWGVLTIGLWLIRLYGSGWAALGAWLVLVNGLLHLAQAAALRRTNPGVVTAAVFFLPLGGVTLSAVWPIATALQLWLSLAIAVAVHAGIVLHVRSMLKRAPLRAANP